MAERSFGWVQEAYKIANLKQVIQIFRNDSEINQLLRADKIPRLISPENGRDDFIVALSRTPIRLSYQSLKGKGTPKGYTRATAPCSGIVQAALKGQKKGKEYQSDWPADSYLRWGIRVSGHSRFSMKH